MLNTFGIKNGPPARAARTARTARPTFDDKKCSKNDYEMFDVRDISLTFLSELSKAFKISILEQWAPNAFEKLFCDPWAPNAFKIRHRACAPGVPKALHACLTIGCPLNGYL